MHWSEKLIENQRTFANKMEAALEKLREIAEQPGKLDIDSIVALRTGVVPTLTGLEQSDARNRAVQQAARLHFHVHTASSVYVIAARPGMYIRLHEMHIATNDRVIMNNPAALASSGVTLTLGTLQPIDGGGTTYRNRWDVVSYIPASAMAAPPDYHDMALDRELVRPDGEPAQAMETNSPVTALIGNVNLSAVPSYSIWGSFSYIPQK